MPTTSMAAGVIRGSLCCGEAARSIGRFARRASAAPKLRDKTARRRRAMRLRDRGAALSVPIGPGQRFDYNAKPMLAALFLAFTEAFTPPLRRVVVLSLALAVVTFVALWLALAAILHRIQLFAWQPLDWAVDVLGTLGVLALSWLLFPAVLTLIMGFFLERVCAAVEAVHYPGREPPRRQGIVETTAVTLRLMGLTILLNLAAVPLYLLVPGINLLVFLALNGYLLGREYFGVVALRRLDTAATKAMRNRYGGRVFLGGVVIAGLFALPLVNLVAPVIATAFMMHLFEALPHDQLPARNPGGWGTLTFGS